MLFRVFVKVQETGEEVVLVGEYATLEEAKSISDPDPLSHIEAKEGIVSEIID